MDAFCQHILRCIVFLVFIFFTYLALSQATESDPFKNLDIEFSDLANNDKKSASTVPFSPISMSTCNSLRISSKRVKKPFPPNSRPTASHLKSATSFLTTIWWLAFEACILPATKDQPVRSSQNTRSATTGKSPQDIWPSTALKIPAWGSSTIMIWSIWD